jgi:hypothetical protein
MNTLRWIGVILMIVGVLLFIGGVVATATHSPAGPPLLIAGGIAVGLGIILDSIGGGGIFVLFRLVGGTRGPGEERPFNG